MILTADVFHPIFQLEFEFLEGHFFDVFRFREKVACREPVEPIVEVVMPGGEFLQLL